MKVRLSNKSISAVQKIVTGDAIEKLGKPLGPHRSGSKLVAFFTRDSRVHRGAARECDRKLREGDYDGAITNARSLVEAAMLDIESRLVVSPPAPDGDLQKLFKRVQRILNLDPERPTSERACESCCVV